MRRCCTKNGRGNASLRISLLGALILACAPLANGQPRAIDTAKSSMTVHVYKAGVFSAFGHDHEIFAPITEGTVDQERRRVEFRVNSSALRVRDPKASDKDRAEIQATMLGPTVLDTSSFKEIQFHSTKIDAAGSSTWNVTGDLTLHGETRPVTVQVSEKDGRFSGTSRFRISDFGIKPIKVAGGAVRVKDEVQIDFEILLQH